MSGIEPEGTTFNREPIQSSRGTSTPASVTPLAIVRACTVLLGSITSSVLVFQVAVNGATNIHYWDIGDDSSGRSIWFGVLAVGLLLAGTILVQQMPLLASVAYAVCLPLVIIYERDHNRGFLSISVSDTLGDVMWLAPLALMLLAFASWRMDDQS